MSAIKSLGLYKYVRSVGAEFADAVLAPIYRFKGRNIERFVLFIGYARSGSTFLGQILNSHPEIIISNEAFRHASDIKNAAAIGKGGIVRRILDRNRRTRNSTSYEKGMGGSSYVVNTYWQGRYSRLRIIGNKNVHEYTTCLNNWPWVLDSLRRHMGVPVSAFFTYRNPYDIIAATYLRMLRSKKNVAIPLSFLDFNPTDAEKPKIEQDFLSSNNKHFKISYELVKVLSLFSEDEIFPVKHEDLIASPRENLRLACEFLGLQCTEEYLKVCAAIAYPSPHKTRFKVRWTSEQKVQVAEAIRKYPWFEGYTYED